nr:MAG TPA: Poxvirus virion envelope protein A14 [Ackermannviridae sp.]
MHLYTSTLIIILILACIIAFKTVLTVFSYNLYSQLLKL